MRNRNPVSTPGLSACQKGPPMTPEQMKSAINAAIKGFNRSPIKEKAQAASKGQVKTFKRQYATGKGQFKRELLPGPLVFFEQHQQMQLRGRGAWRMTRCVFHEDSNASLSVNVENGAYRCHACQAHGGDVLAFYRQLTGASFVDAAQALGAWEVKHG